MAPSLLTQPAVRFVFVLSSAVVGLLACTSHDGRPRRIDVASKPALHATTIVTPNVLRGLPIGGASVAGPAAVTPCATCHGTRDTSPLPAPSDSIQGPHTGLRHQHGNLPCASCHARERRDQLHLADGRTLEMLDAMLLCAQCHGPQKRNYDHGAHGGMRGYWDLASGPRERNHCVACHDPHAPQFGHFAPVAGPRDRFAPAEAHHD